MSQRIQTQGKFLVLKYDGHSVLISKPESYEKLVELAKDVFLSTDYYRNKTTFHFSTTEVDCCSGEYVVVRPCAWDAISPLLRVLHVTNEMPKAKN
ncbi:hypothetical protein CONPUDRAFT_154263 [Coniophora puteana RWD-64-598 SS2]|uniref:PB1 domain-containing protein n=1 Tax=Coniophora puteana (strain RWD-64-598) TaxID=741705 RepID=A0A5M3MMG0_CONPW|nr:uncharacterized protein CONPUDRAFT_154263 [Coniophora puteana RWD-64-598 SS2]EIW80217.1 hypothetical protein CONPUDRAFT_154263 [Coniophora puteana RWD-64-598 SS2]